MTARHGISQEVPTRLGDAAGSLKIYEINQRPGPYYDLGWTVSVVVV